MDELKQMILDKGLVVNKDIVKIDSFLNHRIDTNLLSRMGKEIATHFFTSKPDLILTIEASGIALAISTAYGFGNIPVIFAKKIGLLSQFSTIIKAEVHSFTRKDNHYVYVEKKYLPEGTRVLIVDDFLADGNAAKALVSIVEQTKSTLVGVAVAVEKSFQEGGKLLRERGIDVLSLATIDSIENGQIVCK